MDYGRIKNGIEPRKLSIRIHFNFLGKRRRETLHIKPTPKNLRYASKKRNQILFAIESGTFNYAQYFPDSKNANLGRRTSARTVEDFMRLWLSTVELAPSTIRGYESSYRRYMVEQFGARPIESLVASELRLWRADLMTDYKPKTVNNALIPMRGALKTAFSDEILSTDLARHLENVTIPTDQSHVDPFTVPELHTLIDTLRRRSREQAANLVQFWYCTGLRPSEIMALRWEDINMTHRQACIQRSWVMKAIKSTKTRRIRNIDLIDLAVEALDSQHSYTGAAASWIFPNPNTGELWSRDDALRDNFSRWCKWAGVRRRPPQQLRHTYGSLMLSASEPPLYVKTQMGHTTLQMLERHYAKWIPSANPTAGSAFSKLANGL